MSRQHETKEAILHALRGQRATAAVDLANEVNAHPAVIDRCCTGLQQTGYLRQTAPGVYTLTCAGEAYLDDPTQE
jgi:DNA-binding IclR family transcriptional regulator